MDWQTIINVGATGVIAAVGYFVKSVRDELKEHGLALTTFRLEVAKDYVTHTDLGDIKNALRRIEDKLDAKQDK